MQHDIQPPVPGSVRFGSLVVRTRRAVGEPDGRTHVRHSGRREERCVSVILQLVLHVFLFKTKGKIFPQVWPVGDVQNW